MCIGIPMKIVSCDGTNALAREGEHTQAVDLSLTGPQEPGTWVLTFLGAAREVLEPAEAEKILAAVNGLRRVMSGGDLGDAFADLDNREPQLPPHLQAARDAGQETA